MDQNELEKLPDTWADAVKAAEDAIMDEQGYGKNVARTAILAFINQMMRSNMAYNSDINFRAKIVVLRT